MQQKKQHDHHAQERSFEGEKVCVKNHGQYGQRWLEGYVVTLRGPVSALVELTDGSRVRRHFDQMWRWYSETVTPQVSDRHNCLPESLLLFNGKESSDNGKVSDAVQSPESVHGSSQDARPSPPLVSTWKTYPTRTR